jgi:hypothetical protein
VTNTIREQTWPSGLATSLLLLGAVLAVALGGLMLAGNYLKVLRVALAAGAYVALLLALTRGREGLSVWRFVAAGAVAGLVSGVARTSVSFAVVAAGIAGAGLLVGPLHWWALRTWRGRASVS